MVVQLREGSGTSASARATRVVTKLVLASASEVVN